MKMASSSETFIDIPKSPAIDSNLSEYFIYEKIKYFSEVSNIELFMSNYLENYFYIILIPRHWSYELMEAWKPGASWNVEGK
ncbi:MAG: hypothetical protein AAB069_02000, partial [Planctomycetota bacterium]